MEQRQTSTFRKAAVLAIVVASYLMIVLDIAVPHQVPPLLGEHAAADHQPGGALDDAQARPRQHRPTKEMNPS